MRRLRGISPLIFALLVLALTAGAANSRAGAKEPPGERPAWPAPPADPIVRLDGVIKKLVNFEVAVQGAVNAALRRVDKLKRPSGVAFDERGRLLVTDSRQGVLLRLDLDLGVALVFGTATTPTLKRPLGVASGPDGTIFVADGDLGQIVAFSSDGNVVATYGGGSLAEPVDVALSADGAELYVADSKADSVVRFDVASRREIERFGSRGKGAAEFYGPGAVEVDAEGNLLVVDRLNARVQLFDSTGAFTRAIYGAARSSFSRPRDVTVDAGGRIFVTDEAQSQVQVYRSDLEPLFEFGRNGLGPGEFLGVGGIAAGGDRLAVVDHAGGRVQTFHLYGAERPGLQPVIAETGSTDSVPAVPVESPAEPIQMPDPGRPETPARPEPPAAAAPETQPAVEPAVESTAPAPPDSEAPPGEPEADLESLLADLVLDWAAAWSAQDVERYLTFYSESFLPANGSSRDRWSAERRERIGAPASIEVGIEATEVDLLNPDRAEVIFLQSYHSDRFSDRVRKALVMAREAGGWKIVAETVLETL